MNKNTWLGKKIPATALATGILLTGGIIAHTHNIGGITATASTATIDSSNMTITATTTTGDGFMKYTPIEIGTGTTTPNTDFLTRF